MRHHKGIAGRIKATRTRSGACASVSTSRRRAGSSIDAILARFERAEADGFATAWTGQLFDHDALTLLALAARATRRIELGSWVVPAPLRHPAVLAQQALTAQAASGGRLVLGIGVSHPEVLARFGEAAPRPVPQMREYLELLAPLLAGKRAEHEGERYRVSLQLGSLGAKPAAGAAGGARTGDAAPGRDRRGRRRHLAGLAVAIWNRSRSRACARPRARPGVPLPGSPAASRSA